MIPILGRLRHIIFSHPRHAACHPASSTDATRHDCMDHARLGCLFGKWICRLLFFILFCFVSHHQPLCVPCRFFLFCRVQCFVIPTRIFVHTSIHTNIHRDQVPPLHTLDEEYERNICLGFYPSHLYNNPLRPLNGDDGVIMLLLSVIHAYSWPLVGSTEAKHPKKIRVFSRVRDRQGRSRRVQKKNPPLRPSVRPSFRDSLIRDSKNGLMSEIP